MNIFEALEAGDGKATLPEIKTKLRAELESDRFYFMDKNNNAYARVCNIDLKRNDWIPYVPHEKPKECPNCEHAYFHKIVDINHQGQCYCCNKDIVFRPNNLYFVKQ